MLNGISGLIASIAGLITAVTGLIGMLVVAKRTSSRERDDAARGATERALTPPSQTEADEAALYENHESPKRRRSRRGR